MAFVNCFLGFGGLNAEGLPPHQNATGVSPWMKGVKARRVLAKATDVSPWCGGLLNGKRCCPSYLRHSGLQILLSTTHSKIWSGRRDAASPSHRGTLVAATIEVAAECRTQWASGLGDPRTFGFAKRSRGGARLGRRTISTGFHSRHYTEAKRATGIEPVTPPWKRGI